MEISYFLLDPSKNYTILVETPVDVSLMPSVAASLMEKEPLCEQVGFISSTEGCDIALRMAGGEFCGNAAMSAAVLARLGGAAEPVTVSVSGCGEPVSVSVTENSDGSFTGTVTMPKALSVEELSIGGKLLPVVHLPGISHVIMKNPIPEAEAESAVKAWCGTLGADALGLMLLGEDETSIKPLVYVPSADTIFWEQSCASGTTAVGIYMAQLLGQHFERRFTEPGSSLAVSAAPGENPKLTGNVKIIHKNNVII